jgi:hypothetical protein
MTERCTFYRLNRDQAKQLFSCRSPEALRAFVEAIDPAQTPTIEAGEAALVLHRVLTDGTLEPTAGEYPLNQAVLGGRVLGHETGFAVVVKRPDTCAHVAAALGQVTPETVEAALARLGSAQPGELAGVESSDVAGALAQLTNLFQAAAAGGEAVILVRYAQGGRVQ